MPIDPIREPLRIGYRGQASTIQPSGHDFPRLCGQIKGPQDEAPRLAPTQRLDLELEIGVFIGQPAPCTGTVLPALAHCTG